MWSRLTSSVQYIKMSTTTTRPAFIYSWDVKNRIWTFYLCVSTSNLVGCPNLGHTTLYSLRNLAWKKVHTRSFTHDFFVNLYICHQHIVLTYFSYNVIFWKFMINLWNLILKIVGKRYLKCIFKWTWFSDMMRKVRFVRKRRGLKGLHWLAIDLVRYLKKKKNAW